MILTEKQKTIMRVIMARNEDGSATDLDQILERLDYKPSKESLQFSIRALIARGLIKKDETENRRGRRRVIISATGLADRYIMPTTLKTPSADIDELDDIFGDSDASETIEIIEK